MTTAAQTAAPQAEAERPQRSLWRDAWRRLISSSAGRIGLAISVALILLAVFIQALMPYDPSRDRNLRQRLQPPSMLMDQATRTRLKADTWSLPFGTDELGRDLFVRVLHGAPISLTVGIFSVLFAVVFGTLLGLTAGYVAGWFDMVAVWIMDIMLAFPSILLAIAITTAASGPDSFSTQLFNALAGLPGVGRVLDQRLFNAMLAVGIVEIPIFARISRATVISLRNQEFVTAAQTIGAPGSRILFRHIMPNSLAPLLVQATLSMATAIISVAALGFLGLGARPPRPEWGTMLAGARDYVVQGKWWYPAFPGLAIIVTVLGFNLLGDGLRDALDPRLKR
ncbi:MAG TPA: ABC transporter permease [Herpetosiphonaceae bacterium]